MKRYRTRLLWGGAAVGAIAGAWPATVQASQQEQRERAQDEMQLPAFVSIGTMNDAIVTNAAGTRLAEVHDLIIDTRTGITAYAIIETDGVEGLDDKTCLVPYGALAWDPRTGAYRLSPEPGLLRNLPPFEVDNLFLLSEASWMSTLRGVFGEREEFNAIEQARTHDEYTALFNNREPLVLRGEIAAINREAKSAMGSAYYAVLIDIGEQDAAMRQAMTLIAPPAHLDALNEIPREGETITVNAVRAIDNQGKTVYVAKSATVSGRDTLHLRNDDGAPRWNAAASGSYRMASKLVGGKLIASDGTEFATVDDVVFEARSGTAAYAITSAGGILGIDDTDYAIPCGSFLMTSNGNLYSSLPADKLKLAPKLSEDGVMDLSTREFREQIRSFFGVNSKEYNTMRSTRWTRDGAERRERN